MRVSSRGSLSSGLVRNANRIFLHVTSGVLGLILPAVENGEGRSTRERRQGNILIKGKNEKIEARENFFNLIPFSLSMRLSELPVCGHTRSSGSVGVEE